jgi:hypothetical protein
MNDVDFSRALMVEAHKEVKKHFPKTHLRNDAWVWRFRSGQWEFHGPEKFYWTGHASDGYHARYNGWMAYLKEKGKCS